ncbi:MAG: hypothetical protein EVA34_02275 [Erythrobacter sp.]|nr:MAG: hypothetical protein EVA34_02275 [Erythrobacter sp.]
MSVASSQVMAKRAPSRVLGYRSRHFPISVLLVLAVWSIALSFFSFVFWVIALGALLCVFVLSERRDPHSTPPTSRDFVTALFLSFLLLIQAVWGIMNEYYNLDEILFVSVSVALAIALSKRRVDPLLSWIPFFATASYFFILLILGASVDSLLPQNSRNFLSVILIGLFASAIVLSKPDRVGAVHVVAGLLVLAFSIIGIGRSGIISSFILVIALIGLKVLSGPRSWKKRLFSAVVLMAVTIAFFSSLNEIMEAVPRLASRGFHDYSRNFIHLTFFRELEGPNFILGKNYFHIFQLHRYNYNLHSSYLAAWANLGLVYTLTIIFCILRSLAYRKSMPVIWVALLALGLRAATDIQMIGAKFDYVFLVVLFMTSKEAAPAKRSLMTDRAEYRGLVTYG